MTVVLPALLTQLALAAPLPVRLVGETDNGGAYSTIGQFSMNDRGDLGFYAAPGSYLWLDDSGVLTPLADADAVDEFGTTVQALHSSPNTRRPFTDKGQFFWDTGDELFRSTEGDILAIVHPGINGPGGAPISTIQHLMVSANGDVAFWADSQQILVWSPADGWSEGPALGDPLPGTAQTIGVLTMHGMWDDGTVVFSATDNSLAEGGLYQYRPRPSDVTTIIAQRNVDDLDTKPSNVFVSRSSEVVYSADVLPQGGGPAEPKWFKAGFTTGSATQLGLNGSATPGFAGGEFAVSHLELSEDGDLVVYSNVLDTSGSPLGSGVWLQTGANPTDLSLVLDEGATAPGLGRAFVGSPSVVVAGDTVFLFMGVTPLSGGSQDSALWTWTESGGLELQFVEDQVVTTDAGDRAAGAFSIGQAYQGAGYARQFTDSGQLGVFLSYGLDEAIWIVGSGSSGPGPGDSALVATVTSNGSSVWGEERTYTLELDPEDGRAALEAWTCDFTTNAAIDALTDDGGGACRLQGARGLRCTEDAVFANGRGRTVKFTARFLPDAPTPPPADLVLDAACDATVGGEGATDLAVDSARMTESADLSVPQGNAFAGALEVTNAGPSVARNVVLNIGVGSKTKDDPGEFLKLGDHCEGRTCRLDTLAPGASFDFGRMSEPRRRFDLSVSVTSDTPDPNLANNSKDRNGNETCAVGVEPASGGPVALLMLLVARRMRRRSE